MKLDSNLAWKEAMAAISANKEVLAAIAGVFFMLPSLAFGLLAPQPEPVPGITGEQAMRVATDYYAAALPYLLPMTLLQTAGMLAILTLCTDRTRPTVGEAIKQGFVGILPYVAAHLLLGLGVGLAAAIFGGIAMATGSAAVLAFVVVLLVAGAVYAMLRLSLVSPVIAVEGLFNPVTVLQRSWALSRGNAGRIFLFLLLIGIAFLVLLLVATAILGGIAAVAFGAEAARISGALLSAVLGAGFTVAITAAFAAVHRQLAGPSPDAAGRTFD